MKKRIISFLLTVVMVISILPTMVYAGGGSYSITDGTAPSANGSISFDKTTAAEDDTITITVTPAEGYQLKKLTVLSAISMAPPITPAQDASDKTKYTFKMPSYPVRVTAEFEEKAITIADILPDGFPTSSAGGWLNENGGKSYIMNDNLFVYGKTNVELSKSVTKKDDGNYEYQGTSGTKITFVMESGKLTKINVSGSVYPENNGTYVAPHAHTFTYTANNGKLTATCTAGCDKGYDTTPLTLTLTAPASLVYDGNAKAFTFADGEATAWTGAGLELPTITYYQKYSGQGWYTQLNEVPVNAGGDYMAEIVVNNRAAQVKFTIDKATPYIKTNPEPTDIDYGKKLADSTLAGGYVQVSSSNTTQVGGLFEWTNPDTAPGLDDSEVTEYDVTFTPADTNNYNTVSCKVKIKVTHTHNPVKVNGQAATETASGWKDYYKCDCDALFEDKNGTTPIENLDTWKAEGGNGYIPPLAPKSYTVTFNMNGHGTQIAAQTVEIGSKATKPSDPTASGWTFGGWYTDTTYKVTFDFGTAITTDTTIYAKWTEVTYDFEDDEKLIWQLGSAETLNYVVHRSVDDSETFSLFVGIQVDDVDVSADNYDAKSGSLILNLKPSYLSTLSAGEHTLKILFKDGTISIKFEVKPIDPSPTATPKPDGSLPQTGEADSWTAIGGILLIACAAVLAIVSVRKRREI